MEPRSTGRPGSTQRQVVERWLERYFKAVPAAGKDQSLALRAGERLFERTDEQQLQLVAGSLKALESLSPDTATVLATLVLPLALDDEAELASLRDELPEEVLQLLGQLRTLTHFGRTYLPDDHSRAEGLRRLLMALVADVRVVLVALAWQIARLGAAESGPEDLRRELARETQLIHAPLANRLGIWQLKWQLEDISFRYLEPQTYQRIARLVAEKRSDRQAFIQRFMNDLEQMLRHSHIDAEVSGRAKHIYSIWRKMQRKGLDFHELFDVRAVRVLVDTVEHCYSVLGLVHTRWQPVPGEFDDYITNPKANLYRSLHTAVRTDSGRVVEVQIRTHEMHRHAELGVAAHWRYKEGGPRDDALENRIGVMRRLLERSDGDDSDDDSLLEEFRNLTTEDRIYVLTPKGEVRDLAAGATPLDFAYLIHTEVGHRCRGARVNGRIVPLTYQLNNGDRVEILTGKQPNPSRDWLLPSLGYVGTARARAKIRQWFRQQDQGENQAAGRQAVEAEFRRLSLDTGMIGHVLDRFNANRIEELYAMIGAGDLTATQVAHAVERYLRRDDRGEASIAVHKADAEPSSDQDIRIEGLGSLMHQMARCCQPVPGDEIAGYITRTRGVSIHRQDCRQFLALRRRHPERVLGVHWADAGRSRYPSAIRIDAWDRRDLIKDLGTLLASEKVNVTAMNASHDPTSDRVAIELTVQVMDFEQLSNLMARMQQIPNVFDVTRIR